MACRIRLLVVVLTTAALLTVQAAPAAAEGERFEADSIPIGTDVGMRFLGIFMTAGGFVTFCAASPVIAMTRPTDFGKAWMTWVAQPAKFTWGDPLGYHPDRRDAAFGDLTPKKGI